MNVNIIKAQQGYQTSSPELFSPKKKNICLSGKSKSNTEKKKKTRNSDTNGLSIDHRG